MTMTTRSSGRRPGGHPGTGPAFTPGTTRADRGESSPQNTPRLAAAPGQEPHSPGQELVMPVTATASDHLVGVRGSAQPIHASLDDELLYVIAAAEDFRAGIAEVFTRLRRTRAVAGAEWWTPAADGSSLRLELSAGGATGVRTPIPIGAAGALVLVGESAAGVGDIDAEVITRVPGDFPIAPAALRLVLRNLLANAVAAGARRIYVSALAQGDRRALVVDDDGVGLGSTDGYTSGTQLGLLLCRRLVARFGGVIELKPRAVRGTRAQIVLTGAG